jgi:hypothetical protein
MVERVQKLSLHPENLGADKAYGSAEFLAWLLERGVQRTFRSSTVATRQEGAALVTSFLISGFVKSLKAKFAWTAKMIQGK